MSDLAADGAPEIFAAIRNKLLEPFITATLTALREMADAEVVVRDVIHGPCGRAVGCISAVLRLEFATEGFLLLAFPKPTATNLARRMLVGIAAELDEQLICDCVGEIGNVIAGQAKTLLAGTPHCFTFSLPKVVVDDMSEQAASGLRCVSAIFDGEMGELCLRLCLEPAR